MEQKPNITVTCHQFYFETPLYELVPKSHFSEIIYSGEVDAYSHQYKSPTTYTISFSEVSTNSWGAFVGFHKVSLTNKRKDDDTLVFFVADTGDEYIKVGQYPSLASLQLSELDDKYSKQLARADMALFKKAIGLASHGIGAGSFVYLRRVFEGLIKEAYEQHKDSLTITHEEFQKLRMAEKVQTLSKKLPSQLVEMKAAYGILSLGVHELSEQECLAYFQPLRLSIQLILDQKLEQELKAERDKIVKQELKKIEKILKKS
jgi:hypothetical protein